MKKLLLVLLFVPLISFSQYSNGYSDGWKKGFCYDKTVGCVSPIPPVAPIPRTNEDYTYEAGYNRGFVDGRANKSSRDNRVNKTNDALIRGAKDSAPKYNSIDIGDDFDRGYERGKQISNGYYSNSSTKTKADKFYDRVTKKNRKKLKKQEKKINFNDVLFSTNWKGAWDMEVYQSTSLKSKLISIVEKERKIGVIELIDDKWVKVKFSNGVQGFMMNTLLERKN